MLCMYSIRSEVESSRAGETCVRASRAAPPPRPAPRRSYVRRAGAPRLLTATRALAGVATSLVPSRARTISCRVRTPHRRQSEPYKPQCGVPWSCCVRSAWARAAQARRRRPRRAPPRPPRPTRCCYAAACSTTCCAPRSATPSPPTTSAPCRRRSRRTCAASSPNGCLRWGQAPCPSSRTHPAPSCRAARPRVPLLAPRRLQRPPYAPAADRCRSPPPPVDQIRSDPLLTTAMTMCSFSSSVITW